MSPRHIQPVSRRNLLLAAGAAAVATGLSAPMARAAEVQRVIKNGRLTQGACMGVFRGMQLQQAAPIAAQMGLKGIDLRGPRDWAVLKENGLVGTMTPSHGLTKGLNRRENHAECLEKIRAAIEATGDAGFPNVITFPGNRAGMSDEEGARNMIEGLKQVVGLAEQKKVTLCIELLNSRVNHPDYMADHTEWGVKVCQGVGSERVKLLYDIYHMQIMEGNVIATIRKYKDYIGHYHTAGVPGRNQIDETQELYYPAIMRAIVESGYKGYVCHEYSPRRRPALDALTQAIQACDV